MKVSPLMPEYAHPRIDIKRLGGHRMSTASSLTEGGDLAEQRVTPLELFFDLVFVFALTQVTVFLTAHLTWIGMLQGVALLAALWWAWVGYSWLTNAVPAEEAIPARLVILTAMAAMLVASLAVPDAFGECGVIFGVAFFVVHLLQVLLYALATGREPETRQAILRLAPGFLAAPALLIVAGFLDGFVQGALLAVALAIDYGVAFVRGVSGFRVHAGHFVERHGLIIIIALGESIVAIGVGASGLALGPGVIVAVVRDVGSVSVSRLVVTVLCCALALVAVSVSSLITLAILTMLLCALAAFETMSQRVPARAPRALEAARHALYTELPRRGLLGNSREKRAEKEPGRTAPALLSYQPTDSLGSPHLSMSLALSNSPLS
jgi:hypothetical protein